MDSRRETAAYMAILALKNRTTTKKPHKKLNQHTNKQKPNKIIQRWLKKRRETEEKGVAPQQ